MLSLSEKEVSKDDYRRRTILLTYDPNNITKSQKLYEWTLTNIIRPNLDHVYLLSVLHVQKTYYPIIDNVWTFGLVGYSNTYSTDTYHEDYQNYIKNEQESTKRILRKIAGDLSEKNVTSNIIISRGSAREEILNICESINPDIVLIGSSPSKSKVRNLLNRSILNHIKNNVNDIQVISNIENDDFRNKINKINEPKVSKKKIYRTIHEVMKQIKPKSFNTDVEPTGLNKSYHKLSD